MISIREEITIATPPDVLWPILSDPAMVASCIPGAALTKSDEGDTYQGTMRVKFGPTVALFRGEAKLAYDHPGRRCTIQGRGIDGRGASRANASGTVEATGDDTTLLKVTGNFNVTGPRNLRKCRRGAPRPGAPCRLCRERREASGRTGAGWQQQH